MKLSLIAIQFPTSIRDTVHSPKMGQTMTIDITSKLFILLAAYTLVHAAVFFWYQSKKQALVDAQDNPANNGTGTAPKRRIGIRQ
jgi:hypothetical protein